MSIYPLKHEDASSIDKHGKMSRFGKIINNVLLLAPIIVLGSIAASTVFYTMCNDWPIGMAFFFATQALFGCMYGVPSEEKALSQTYTLGLYLWGSTLCSAAIGAFASHLVSHATLVSRDERKRLRLQSTPSNTNLDGSPKPVTANEFFHQQSLFHANMKNTAVIAALVWLVIGTVAVSTLEGKSIGSSVFFSLGAITAAGTPSPLCLSSSDDIDCEMGTGQSVLLALYIIIGVPLFTFAFGQFALAIVERAIRADERKILERPLTGAEFQLLRSLHDDDLLDDPTRASRPHRDSAEPQPSGYGADRLAKNRGTGNINTRGAGDVFELTLADFIVLELIRLQKIDEEDLASIKALFERVKNSQPQPQPHAMFPESPLYPTIDDDYNKDDIAHYAPPQKSHTHNTHSTLISPRDDDSKSTHSSYAHLSDLETGTPSGTANNRLGHSISLSKVSGLDTFNAAVLLSPSTGGATPGAVATAEAGSFWGNIRMMSSVSSPPTRGGGDERDALLRKISDDPWDAAGMGRP